MLTLNATDAVSTDVGAGVDVPTMLSNFKVGKDPPTCPDDNTQRTFQSSACID